MIKDFNEFLALLKTAKGEYQLKLNASPIFIMIMAGVFDDLFQEKLTLADRFNLIQAVKKTMKSSASLSKARGDVIGMEDIDSELIRNTWMVQVNPAYIFRIADHFSQALKVMGYADTGKPNLRFRKGEEDIFTNFTALFSEQCIKFYGSKFTTRVPGIIAIYKGYQSQAYGDKKFLKVTINDGTQDFNATIWPIYGTNDAYDPACFNSLKTGRKKTFILLGKVSKGARGYHNFTIKSMKLLG